MVQIEPNVCRKCSRRLRIAFSADHRIPRPLESPYVLPIGSGMQGLEQESGGKLRQILKNLQSFPCRERLAAWIQAANNPSFLTRVLREERMGRRFPTIALPRNSDRTSPCPHTSVRIAHRNAPAHPQGQPQVAEAEEPSSLEAGAAPSPAVAAVAPACKPPLPAESPACRPSAVACV
jgi:hypothetical protein